MMTTVTKQIDGAILYYLDDKEKPKKTYVLPTLVHNPYKFNFGMNWSAFEHIQEMTAEKTTDGNIILYRDDNIYQIKKIGGNLVTEGIRLSHNRFGKIHVSKGKTCTFRNWENVTYLCDNLEQFVRKYDLFGTN